MLTTNPMAPINMYDLPNMINNLCPLLKDFLNLKMIPKIQFSWWHFLISEDEVNTSFIEPSSSSISCNLSSDNDDILGVSDET